ncbi:MAG: lamin tail domain-containing protein [Fidelibacterota bacterium]
MLAIFLAPGALWPSSVRIMDYNVLNFSGNDDAKESALRTVIQEAGPDLFMAEELVGQNGYDQFLSQVLNYSQPDLFTGAPFTNLTADQDIGLFYKSDLFTFVSTSVINITDNYGLRDAVEFVLVHNTSGVEIRLYGIHLKASSGSDNEAIRASEATILRNYLNTLPAGSLFLVLGDFNFYHSGEAGFQTLVDSTDDNDGRLYDPVNRIGYWHNNSAFADVHTQSPRASFGGMDDRFDWIFAGGAILQTNLCNYLPDSYQAFGNDGNHFNLGINEGTNTAVPAAVADALVTASDHIPVMADFEFVDLINSSAKVVISEIMPNPAAVSDSYGEWFELFNADTLSYDLTGWTLTDGGADQHVIAPDSGELRIDPGEYLVLGRSRDESTNGGVQVDYQYSGFLLSNTEDEIIIYDDQNQLVDQVEYSGTFPFSSGTAMYITDFSADNNDPLNWSAATTPYGLGDLGTPGQAWDDPLSTGYEMTGIPKTFALHPAQPNPFNPATSLSYDLPWDSRTKLVIYDLRGREVRTLVNREESAGTKRVLWDGRDNQGLPAASGVYLYSLTTNALNSGIQVTAHRKLVLLK